MSGRAQAANLTGMLSQLASDVGEMGKAYDWTHNAVRTFAMPKVDETDVKSLEAYAEWARRNGKDDIAYAYSKRAADLAVEQQKRAYTKSVAQGKESIRGLLTDRDALEAKPIGNNELYGEPGQLPIQAQINNVPGQIQKQVGKLNDLGDSSRYGTGVEGSTALREVQAERMQAVKDALSLKKAGLDLSKAEREAIEPLERRIYNTEATELMGSIRELARTPNKTAEQQSALDGYVSELNDLSSEYGHLTGIDVGAGTTYLNKEVDQVAQERSAALAQANAQVTLNAGRRQAEINAEIDKGKNMGATLFAAGIREIPPARRAQMTPDAIKAAEAEIKSSAEAADRVNEAKEKRTVSSEDLAYAEELAKGNPAIRAQLEAYKRELKQENVFDRSEKVAGKLQDTIEKARKESGDLTEDLYRDASIGNWTAMTVEYGDLTNLGDDIADILQDDEDLEAIKPEIKKLMKAQNITSFENAGQFISIATQAARNLGFAPVETEESNAAVTDTINFANKVKGLEQALYDEVYESLEGYSEEGRVAKAKRETKKVLGNVVPHMNHFLKSDDIGWQRMQITNPNSLMSQSFSKISLGDGRTLRDALYDAVTSQDTPVTLGQLGLSYE